MACQKRVSSYPCNKIDGNFHTIAECRCHSGFVERFAKMNIISFSNISALYDL